MSWSSQSSGTTSFLLGVWGSSGSDVFAVGSGIVLHYDGTAWLEQENGSTATLQGIWGTGPTDLFAVGRGAIIQHGTR